MSLDGIVSNSIQFRPITTAPTTQEREDIELALLAGDSNVINLTHEQVAQMKKENWKEKWWAIHEEEDAEAKEDKTAKKLEPIGRKQYIVLGVTCAAVTGLQYIFEQEPVMKGTVGATMNAYKIVYIQTAALKDTRVPQNVLRVIAGTMLASAIVFRFVPEDSYGIISVLRKLPLTDASLAIFAKCDLNSLRLDKKLIELVRRCCNRELPSTAAKIITLIGQATVMGTLMSIPNIVGDYVATGAAVLKKATWRRMADILWQKIDNTEDPVKRKAGIALAVGSSVAVTGASAYAATTTLFQNPYFQWLPVAAGIISFDAASRVGKQMINAYDLPEDDDLKEKYNLPKDAEIVLPPSTCMSRFTSVLQTIGLFGATAGISAVVGPTMINPPGVQSVTTTPAFLITACQEAGSYLKVATGKIMKSTAALAGTAALVALGTGVYLARTPLGIDRYTTPGYGACIFALSSLFTTAMYLNKLLLKAPKKAKASKAKPIETEENPRPSLFQRIKSCFTCCFRRQPTETVELE